jgi:dTMP kinase
MTGSKGAFIVLEGSDGSGKATQVKLLQDRLEAAGYEVEVFAFPRYDQPSSHFIKEYLKGAYGLASTVNPYTASLFYALDRYEAAPKIREALEAGKIVLADRYAGSNMAHQGSKFVNAAERRGFFVWAESIEFQMLGIPRPDINIFLRVPAEVSIQLLTNRPAKDAGSNVADQHERNLEHLKAAVETYDMLCQLFVVDYKSIDCVKAGQIMDRQAIHARIWQVAEPLLPAMKNPQSPEPAAKKPVPAKKIVTKRVKKLVATDDVLEWQIDGVSLIAAFGLQRAGLDVQLNYNNHWAGPGTAYKYIVPEGLNESLRREYRSVYETIIGLHKKLYEKLEASGAIKRSAQAQLKNAVPMGAVFSAKVKLDKSIAGEALQKLRTHPNQEIASLQSSLAFALEQKVQAAAAEKTAQSAPESINDILEKITTARPDYGADLETLRIIEYNPRNEFELIADSIFSRSSLTRDEILLALDKLTYEQKTGELKKALAAEAVLRLPVYRFDALTDWLTLSDLLTVRAIEVINVQQLTARYGYELPAKIEAAGLEDSYMEIFDLSLGLFSKLQLEYEDDLTQYATLTGNKVRWQGRINAAALKDASFTKNEIVLPFIKLLVAKVKEVHPLIVGAIAEPPKKPAVRRRRSSSRKR